jgi:hypothetical protein
MQVSSHHRRPRSRGGDESHKNISIVKDSQHNAWHLLFENKTPQQIADFINAVWLDPDFKFQVIKR